MYKIKRKKYNFLSKKIYIIIILVFSLQIKFLNMATAESSSPINYLGLYRVRLGLENIGQSNAGQAVAEMTGMKWLGTSALWYGLSEFISKADDFISTHFSDYYRKKNGTFAWRITKFLFKHILILSFIITFHKKLTTSPADFLSSSASLRESLQDAEDRIKENIEKIIINFNNDQETSLQDAKITEQALNNLSLSNQKIILEKTKTHRDKLTNNSENKPTEFQKMILNWAKKVNQIGQ